MSKFKITALIALITLSFGMTAIAVAIDTVPLPERVAARFRLESFFLDHLRAANAIDAKADLNARFRLNSEAIRFIDDPEVGRRILGDTPWSLAAGVIITDGRTLLIESLIGNGILPPKSQLGWKKISRMADFIEMAPSLFRQVEAKGWSAQKALDILDRSFAAVSGAAYPAPDSYWEKYCREHPENPVCWVMGGGFSSVRARNLARELVLVSLLQEEKLLSVEQTRAIYDAMYRDLTPHRRGTDLPIPAGIIIVDGLPLPPNQRAEVVNSLGTNRVGLVDPDSPWADKCFAENPPPICKFIHACPVAATLTSQLIKYKVWSKKDALEAWNRLYMSVAEGIIIDLSPKIGTWPTPERKK